MQKIEYAVKAVFKTKKDLEKFLQGKHAQDNGTYLIKGSNDYAAFYDLKKDKIYLEFSDNIKSIKQKTNIIKKFFEEMDKIIH